MKVAGVDDGYFPLIYKGRRGKTILLSSVFEGLRLVDVDFKLIEVDGLDGPVAYNSLMKGDVNLIDGVTVAGFNYIEPGPNDIVVFAHKPEVKKVERALEKHFHDGREKVILYVMSNLRELPTKRGTLYVFSYLEESYVREVIEKYQVFSKVPYPLYFASKLAKSLSKFLITGLNFL